MSFRCDWNLVLRNQDVFAEYKKAVEESNLPEREKNLLLNGEGPTNPSHTFGCYLRAEHLGSVKDIIFTLNPANYLLTYSEEMYSGGYEGTLGKLKHEEIDPGEALYDLKYIDQGHWASEYDDLDSLGIDDYYVEGLEIVATRRSDGAKFHAYFSGDETRWAIDRPATCQELSWRGNWQPIAS